MVLRLDDFTTGAASVAVPSPAAGTTVVQTLFQTGAMLGNGRMVVLHAGHAPSGAPARLEIGGGRLDLTLDSGQSARLELFYGLNADHSSSGLLVNLQQGGADRIRTRVAHLDPPVVNFNLQVNTPAGLSTASGNLPPGPIDFLFADFTGPPSPDFTAVNLIAFVFQVNGSISLSGIDTESRGSLLGDARAGAWLTQFGALKFLAPRTIQMRPSSPVGDRFHTEAHHAQVLGADFVYSARISADWDRDGLAADLQFRISDEGRYGVRLNDGRISLYRFMLPCLDCADNAATIRPCPKWPAMDGFRDVDLPVEYELNHSTFDRSLPAVGVTVVASGSHFIVAFDAGPMSLGRFEADDAHLGVGRFGVYALATTRDRVVTFEDLSAITDPAAPGNFTLLYSVPGYDANGTKRALVRTLNDLDAREYDPSRSSFTLRNSAAEVLCGPLLPDRAFSPGERLPRAFGMQVWTADFSRVTTAGTYSLDVRIGTTRGLHELRSVPFEIRPGLVTDTMLWPLSVLNAEMRSAADDEFRRNWVVESGTNVWSVGVDGAFLAVGADDQAGAVLRRVNTMSNEELAVVEFRLVGSVTILDGCDAQLQFRITPTERWGVTLQAGAAGGCRHHTGGAAVRLHRERMDANGGHVFDTIESQPLPNFQLGRTVDIEVRALQQHIQVVVDGVVLINRMTGAPAHKGAIALKAWGSTVRFEHVKVWPRNVALSHPRTGVWIPYDRTTELSSQGFRITVLDTDPAPATNGHPGRPDAAQQHGFNDCNNVMGEITSHGVFLSALLDVWSTRVHAASHDIRERLRSAIVRAAVYFNELYEEANHTGEFAHQEPGRAALGTSDPKLTAAFAMYGLSSLAERGAAVEETLARTAYDRVKSAFAIHGGRDIFLDSIVAIRMARAAGRLGEPAGLWLERAQQAAQSIMAHFDRPDAIAAEPRPTLRTIPWFEGIFEMVTRGPITLTGEQLQKLKRIAGQFIAVMHDPANHFRVLPQAQDDRNPPDAALPLHNWRNLADVPLAVYPIPKAPAGTAGDWYVTTGFATHAAECVYLGRLTNMPELERIATGNLHWMFGLNPGVPSTKLAMREPPRHPWSVASFLYRGPGPFGRTIEGNRTRESATKSTLAPWEGGIRSRHRETWWFDPPENGYMTITNGHIIREGQWHNWTVGVGGWVCGETFMLTDAVFLKAALALEDWFSGSTGVQLSPYDTTRPHFVDTTHLDRVGSNWPFDDPDRTSYAQAHRMATEVAAGKGLGGGRVTGHRTGERIGVLCLPRAGTAFFDIGDDEIAATPFSFDDINTAGWAQIARAATEVARARGFGAGIFTGHQLPNRRGWIGIAARLVEIFDIDDRTVQASPWRFDDINSVPWAQAARLATDVCIARGFAGGFFTGHQLADRRQIAAVRLVPLA